jgi:hypothetical protein
VKRITDVFKPVATLSKSNNHSFARKRICLGSKDLKKKVSSFTQ